ncbi:MAG: restriction endonuclease subunit S [Pseudomonadales bacterium]|nr:restriction endonuclease subunit S [Pseudomonadales bacterium]
MSSLNSKSLGEVCEFFNGKAHEKSISEDGQFKVINSKFISSQGKVFKLTDNMMFPLYIGDICLVMSDVPNGKTLAKCFLIDADDTYSLNQRICAIRTDSFDLKFLYYQLNRHPFLLAFNNGENQTNLRKNDILSCPLWVPPIPEQKHIVAILDQAFADIELAHAKTEQNLLNARELFESYLNGIFTQRGDGWAESPLGEIAELVDSLHKTPKYIKEGGYPMVRVTEIKKSGLNLKNAKRVDEEVYNEFSKRHKSSIGDIILSRVGASYGVPVIVETDELFCLGQNTVFILPKINPYWLYYFLLSPVAKNQIDSFAAGSAQPTVSMKSIRQISVPMPLRSTQDKIELEIKIALRALKDLEVIYSNKLNLIDELKKSILQKAFSGELTKTPNAGMSKGSTA